MHVLRYEMSNVSQEEEEKRAKERWAWEHDGRLELFVPRLISKDETLVKVFLMPPMPIVLRCSFLFLLARTT